MSVQTFLEIFLSLSFHWWQWRFEHTESTAFRGKFVGCTVSFSTTSMSWSWVTFPASGDDGCGTGENGSHSTRRFIFPANTQFVIAMGTIDKSCLQRRCFVVMRSKGKSQR